LFHMGRLVEQKGQWHLIRAFATVAGQDPAAQLIICGVGPEQDYLRELITQSGLENNVTLYGYDTNPYKYLAHADAFVFSSLYEGLGNSILEALACGTPVITTDCQCGPRELLYPDSDFTQTVDGIVYAPYGILVPVVDGKRYTAADPLTPAEEKLAEAMLALKNDPQLRSHYVRQSKLRAADFDSNLIVEEWKKQFETLFH